jgi:hypothetical protein
MGAYDAEAITRALASKIGALPAECVAEIEEFVEQIARRVRLGSHARGLTQAAAKSSEGSFAAVWNNPEDDVYDAL